MDARQSHTENKYNFLLVLLMATKVAKVNKRSRVKDTILVNAGRFFPGPSEPHQRATGACATLFRCFKSRQSSRLAGDVL